MTTSPCPAAVRVAHGPERSPRRDLIHLAAVIYPLVYWMLMALVTVVSTPRGFFGTQRRGLAQWHTPRDSAPVDDRMPATT